MLRLTPPIGTVALCEYRLNDPEGGVDLSVPLPPPRQRQQWEQWDKVCKSIDRALRGAKGVLREPWLEFDHPFRDAPGVFFRLDHRRGPRQQGVLEARRQLLPSLTTTWLIPEPGGGDLGISHCGFFPGRPSHQQGRIRLNLTGPHQWSWLQQQASDLCTPGLHRLLNQASLCWSATLDWGGEGLDQLGFELFPAGRLQRGSAADAPEVQALLHTLAPWCPAAAIEHCRRRHHNWHQEVAPGHTEGFSHIKLSPHSDGTWSMKLYLLSHATG